MNKLRKKALDAAVYLLSAVMLLTAIPETAVMAAGTAGMETKQIETVQPETEQTETEQVETVQPETEQTGTEQSETEQPETEQTETEQPETEQVETFQSKTEQAESVQSEAAAEVDGVLTPEEMYEIDGGDAEYWKYYDAKGNPIINEEVQTYAASSAVSGLTLKSPYNSILYAVLSGYQISHAIDVSKYNNQNSNDQINWSKVKADGIDSVIIRCGNRGYGTAGTMMTDPYFEKNIKNALAAGLKVGIYIYSQAITTAEAVEEANHCLKLCAAYLDKLDLPIVMDVEYANPGGGDLGGRLYDANLTKAEQTEICKAFCKTIKDAGYQAMVYANQSMLTDEMYPSQLTDAGYQVWLARYNNEAGYSASPYIMWQYSSAGSVSGITGNVDVNFLYTSSDETEAPEWKSVSVANGTKVNLSWNVVPGAEGYEIQRSTDQKTWSGVKTVDAAAAICWTDETAAAETTYYYRIRTYYTENGTKSCGSWSDDLQATTSLATPSLKSAQVVSAQSVKLTWASVPQAEGYLVYRKEAGEVWDMNNPVTTAAAPKTDSGTVSFTDQSVKTGKTYCYTVKAYYTLSGEVHYSKYNTNGIQVKVVPAQPGLTSVTAVDYRTLKFTWKEVPGADGYQVYRKVSGGSWSPVSNDPGSTVYKDTNVNTGTTYYYSVSAYFLSGNQKIEGSRSSTGLSGKTALAAPTVKSISSAGYNSIKITWGKVSGADGYQVFRKTSGGSWSSTPVKDGLTTTSWTNTGVTTGKTYYYAVCAYRMVNGKKVVSSKSSSVSGKAIPATPKLGKVTSVNYKNLKVTWSGVSGASGYRIYRKESGGGWKYLADVKSTARSFTDGYKITTGKKYYYTVRAYRTVSGTRIYGKYNTTGISGKAIPSAPSLTAKSTQAGKVKLSWKKISGASGYAVYRKSSASGKWTRIKTITSGSTISYTTSATRGKYYYYTVRAYRKVGSSNVYSNYSKTIKIKAK
ncbi:MAG: GH25 family lysozyme [Lachnospiraceae bacterium]|nr:GH25 family lysozyme [Lachnospiraceae bacterium]